MRGVGRGQAARRHVSVTDGLDLLDAVLPADAVEGAEAFMDVAHQLLRTELFAHRGEAFEIREEHRDMLNELGLRASFRLEFVRHLLRQDVVQQIIRTLFLHAQFRRAFVHLDVQLIALPRQQAVGMHRTQRHIDRDGDRHGEVDGEPHDRAQEERHFLSRIVVGLLQQHPTADEDQ